LQITFGNCLESMRIFYSLHNLTRRRHGLPPQQFTFFENIARHVLRPAHGFTVTARVGKRPVAAAVYFHQGRQAIFKFGASDYAFQHLRPNNLVMWEAIKRYAADGFTSLHLGRTSLANQGLRRYKLGFGAREERIEDCRYDFRKRAFTRESHPTKDASSRVFRCLPLPLLRLAGRMIYPHLS
jgi:lipid II:glycine glycyltransferase (peptidoglycan interpeptide bridge formation enzyme)